MPKLHCILRTVLYMLLGAPSPFGYRWEIPLTWVTDQDPRGGGGGGDRLKWMRKNEKHVEVEVPSGEEGKKSPKFY